MQRQRRFILEKNPRHKAEIDTEDEVETEWRNQSQVDFLIRFQVEKTNDRVGGNPGWKWDAVGNMTNVDQANQGSKHDGRVDFEEKDHPFLPPLGAREWCDGSSREHEDMDDENEAVPKTNRPCCRFCQLNNDQWDVDEADADSSEPNSSLDQRKHFNSRRWTSRVVASGKELWAVTFDGIRGSLS